MCDCFNFVLANVDYHLRFESNQILWWVESGNGLTAYDNFVDTQYETHKVASLENRWFLI